MNATEKGRARQQALFNFLGQYQAATTDQLARLIWGGDARLARAHLLEYYRKGLLHRLPHPLFRNGSYVYTRSDRATTHSQKILHHLAAVDFHTAVAGQLGRYGARTVPELPWAPALIPDQTVFWRDTVWAVEHHLSGQFLHTRDYQRFMEEEGYTLCHWWREGIQMGLMVLTPAVASERVKALLRRDHPPCLVWRVVTPENCLRDPGVWLKPPEKHPVREAH